MLKRGVVFSVADHLILEILSPKKMLTLSCSLKEVMVIDYTKVYMMVRRKVTHISLTLYTVLSLNQCHKMHFSIRKIQGEYLLPSTLCFNLKYLLI